MRYMLFLMMMVMIIKMTKKPITEIMGSYEIYFRDCVVTYAQGLRRKQKTLRMLSHKINAPK
jgi:hypothetical protein